MEHDLRITELGVHTVLPSGVGWQGRCVCVCVGGGGGVGGGRGNGGNSRSGIRQNTKFDSLIGGNEFECVG